MKSNCPPPLSVQPPEALYEPHVSHQISSESVFFLEGCNSGIALHPPNKPCRTCRPSTARDVAHQAASEKVSRYRGCLAAALAGIALHCATMLINFIAGEAKSAKNTQGKHPCVSKQCPADGV